MGEQTEANSLLFCRSTQLSLLRLLTTRAVFGPYGILPLSNHVAWELFNILLSDVRVCQVSEPSGLEPYWKKFAGVDTSSPKLWMDSYLAAFAIAGGYQLVTIDAAFRQFQDLDLLLIS